LHGTLPIAEFVLSAQPLIRRHVQEFTIMYREKIKSFIRTIPDFPKPGIQFRDITTLLKQSDGLRLTIDALAGRCHGKTIDVVAGIESRGFIIGAPLALRLGVGFVPIRKPGKLPADTVGIDYQLEYGRDRVELHADAIAPGSNVLLVDDLVATGGTALASAALIEKVGGRIVECLFVIDLPDLGGRKRLEAQGYRTFALCEFDGD
jgi:adenine phosphoribosyltransferase